MENKNGNTGVSKNYKKKDYITNKFMYTFDEYMKNPLILKKFKIYQLKIIAKKLNLHITGKKIILIQRIEEHYIKTYLAIKLQKIYRGYIVRESIILKGPALRNRDLCVNKNDGYSLEPINEIPYQRFYSYRDSKNFVYGFDIIFLIIELKKKGKILNPFSMSLIDDSNVRNILKIEKVIKQSYSYILDKEELEILNSNRFNNNNNNYPVRINSNQQNTHIRFEETIIINQNELTELKLKMDELRLMSITQRIENLFIEIDLLGNYTTSEWFKNLTHLELSRLFNCLYDIWHFRARLSTEVKKKICHLNDLFLMNNSRIYTNETVREHCIFVMENMIHYGVDREHKQLGALHVLSALTVVSIPARISMNWLYEAII